MKLKHTKPGYVYKIKSSDKAWNGIVFTYKGTIDQYHKIDIIEPGGIVDGYSVKLGSSSIGITSHINQVSTIIELGTIANCPEYFL